jgi:uncharacterized protein (DUF885 family)
MRRATPLLFTALACLACSEPAVEAADSSTDLTAILDELWEHELERSVEAQIRRGLPVTELPPVSYEDAQREADYQRDMVSRLSGLDREALPTADRTTLDVVLWESSMAVEGFEHFWLESFLTPYASPLRTLVTAFPAMPLATQAEADAYLALASKLPALVEALEDRARGQAERGIAVSRANLAATIDTWRSQMVPAEQSFAWPAAQRLEALSEASVLAFRAQLAQTLEEDLGPALESLVAFLEGPYAAVAPDGVGLIQYEGGPEYYEHLTRLYTTMDVSPEDVQQVGHELLADFRRAMDAIRQEVGFEGTRDEFHEMLRTDPRFFPTTPDEVKERLETAAHAMWARIDDYFETTQQAAYGARRLRLDLEPTMTYGYYNPPSAEDPVGYYNFNGSSLDQRSWIGLAGIGLHELIPGHHFQIARQLENEALHELRRARRHTAYTEGWGSYASFLGLEAGVYEDPYSRYGLYVLESFLATRLVVDPGMNYFGMSLDEARDFMRENTQESETQITTESLRYSTDIPGQALGYQMGKRALLDLRSRAEEALGNGFDVRAFHEAVLENGSLPMVVLDRRVDRFIEEAGGAR